MQTDNLQTQAPITSEKQKYNYRNPSVRAISLPAVLSRTTTVSDFPGASPVFIEDHQAGQTRSQPVVRISTNNQAFGYIALGKRWCHSSVIFRHRPLCSRAMHLLCGTNNSHLTPDCQPTEKCSKPVELECSWGKMNTPPIIFMLVTGKCSMPSEEVDGTHTLICKLTSEARRTLL